MEEEEEEGGGVRYSGADNAAGWYAPSSGDNAGCVIGLRNHSIPYGRLQPLDMTFEHRDAQMDRKRNGLRTNGKTYGRI